MRELLRIARKELIEDRACVMVVIARASGSTPRKAGASMLVGTCGILAGTIGGGLLEHQCTQKAQALVGQERGCIERFVLDNTKAEALGMICGGNTDVLFFPFGQIHLSVVESALTMIDGIQCGSLCLNLDGVHIKVEHEDVQGCHQVCKQELGWLWLPLLTMERILLVGGGHVAQEVGKLLAYLKFRYLIVDDRAEFATRERFPDAEAMIVTPFSDLHKRLETVLEVPLGEMDGICIMTRGHVGDTEAVRYALGTKASYIGVMGSLRKRETVMKNLVEEGFLDVRDRVITPIGLDIGAQTPEELAISIVGELIQWRARKV